MLVDTSQSVSLGPEQHCLAWTTPRALQSRLYSWQWVSAWAPSVKLGSYWICMWVHNLKTKHILLEFNPYVIGLTVWSGYSTTICWISTRDIKFSRNSSSNSEYNSNRNVCAVAGIFPSILDSNCLSLFCCNYLLDSLCYWRKSLLAFLLLHFTCPFVLMWPFKYSKLMKHYSVWW